MRRGIFGLAFLAVCAWLAGATLGGTVGGGGGAGANGQTTITFGASPNLIAPSGNLTLTAADGGVVLDTNRLQLGSGDEVRWSAGNGSIVVPDGGLTIGPNKTTFSGQIASQTEQTIMTAYGGISGTALSGAAAQSLAGKVVAQAFTVTRIAGRWISSGPTATADIRVADTGGNACECSLNCTTNGAFGAACVNGTGTGCAFAANAALTAVWGFDRDGGLDFCGTSQPSFVNIDVMAKPQ